MKDKKKTRKRRRFDDEFKEKIVEMYQDGRSASSLAESFDINPNLIYRWNKKAKESQTVKEVDQQSQIKQLRKKLKQTEQERDILKKALSIFSRQI